MTSSVNFSDIQTPADLVDQNDQVATPLEVAFDAVGELNFKQTMALCTLMLSNVRDFHHQFANDKAEGRQQFGSWVYDEALVSAAITLLNRVDYGQKSKKSDTDTQNDTEN